MPAIRARAGLTCRSLISSESISATHIPLQRKAADALRHLLQRDVGEVAQLEAIHRKRTQQAGHHHLVAERPLVGRIVSRQVDARAGQLADRPRIAGIGLGQPEVAHVKPRHVQRIAPGQAPERQSSLQQLVQRPGQARGLPFVDLQLAVRPAGNATKRYAAVEQAHLDRFNLHAALGQAGLQTRGGEAFGKRDCRGADPDQGDEGTDSDDGFPHGSASCCFEGWAASKAGCFMQVS